MARLTEAGFEELSISEGRDAKSWKYLEGNLLKEEVVGYSVDAPLANWSVRFAFAGLKYQNLISLGEPLALGQRPSTQHCPSNS